MPNTSFLPWMDEVWRRTESACHGICVWTQMEVIDVLVAWRSRFPSSMTSIIYVFIWESFENIKSSRIEIIITLWCWCYYCVYGGRKRQNVSKGVYSKLEEDIYDPSILLFVHVTMNEEGWIEADRKSYMCSFIITAWYMEVEI